MIPQTPESWLPVLAQRLDDRAPRLALLRRYLDGNPPLQEGSVADEAAYQEFQKKARTNFAELVVDAKAERMRIAGFQIGTATDDDDAARKVWDANALQVGAADIHRDMLALGVAYAVVLADGAVMTEAPEFCITDDDPRTRLPRAGLIVWRDESEGFDFADVFAGEVVQRFRRPISMTTVAPAGLGNSAVSRARATLTWTRGKWEAVSDPLPHGYPEVPIVKFANRDEVGEFERHTDILDRINWGLLQRLVITAMQAFRQRAVKGELPTHDAEGNEIDWAKVFAPGPGALWTLPDGVDIWESVQTDIQPILTSTKDDIQHLAAVTRTPMATFMPEGANQSAEGAAFAREGLVFATEDRIARADGSWTRLMRLRLRVDEVVAKWLPAERQSLNERADAATKAKEDLPWRTRLESIWQFSGEQIDRMEVERAADAMHAALMTPRLDAAQVPAAEAAPAGADEQQQAATLKAKADALGALIRAGVTSEDAARLTGLDAEFIGGVPITMRLGDDADA